jgi:hypothetical protein
MQIHELVQAEEGQRLLFPQPPHTALKPSRDA